MPITHDVSDPDDGTRTLMLQTPCGFQIALMRIKTGELRMNSHFNGLPAPLTNSRHRLSADGARELAETILHIYGRNRHG